MPRKQQAVPGTQQKDIKELDSIAEELAEVHQDLTTAKNKESALRARMVAAMDKRDRTLYEHSGMRYTLKAGDPKLSIKTLKDDEE